MTKRVNLRKTHPTLFWWAVVFALINISLGLNFIFTKPTFNPYQIDYRWIGSIFIAVGAAKLVALTAIRYLKLIRGTMAVSAGWQMFWGIGTSITFFTGQTSLQLFVLYFGYCVLQVWWLREPFANPLTGSNGK